VAAGSRAFVDLGEPGPVGLGGSLAWALRAGAGDLDVLAEASEGRDLGVIARQARLFAPEPRVWRIDRSDLARVDPAPLGAVRVPAPATAEQVLLMEQAGLEVVVEQGVVLGELRGLEVARVTTSDDGTADLQVGVGRFDREAFSLLHADLAPPDALARVVAQIDALRRPGAEPHPANRLVRERWLRRQLVEDPALVGLVDLAPVETPRPRAGLRESAIAAGVGHRADGTTVVVATSVGIDLEAVPAAADARAWHAPDAELVLVVPAGDAHPVTRRLAGRLVQPATVLEVDPVWSR
jgi:hypothetical protein